MIDRPTSTELHVGLDPGIAMFAGWKSRRIINSL